jgi:hypothetical protein
VTHIIPLGRCPAAGTEASCRRTVTRGRCEIDDSATAASRRRGIAPLAALAVLAAAALLAGCGGSDDDEAGPTTSAPAETETSTTAGDTRLSAASWASFQTAAARAQKTNQAATAVFRRCADEIPTAPNGDAVAACMGGAAGTVVAEGTRLLDTLDGFEQEASGACAAALDDLAGYTKLYVSSVNGLETSIENDQTAGMQGQIDDSLQVLAQARAARAPVTAACKPVAG